MGRRTIAGHKLTFNKQRKREEHICPADLGNEGLWAIFARWAEGLMEEGLIQVGGQSFLRVKAVNRFSNHVVIVDTLSGKAGEEGVVYDAESGESRLTLTENDVPASSARAILVSPPRGEVALWFSEYSARSSGASLLLDYFKKSWRNFDTGTTFNKDRLIASEIALEKGLVTEVEVRTTRRSDDHSDGVVAKEGVVSHRFKPTKNKWISGAIIDVFRMDRSKAYDLVEISAPDAGDKSEIYVSVNVDGRTRKVEIFNPDDGVYFREELNASNAPILSDLEIVYYCAGEAKTFLERNGCDWEESWTYRR